jgi:hypothetical protein
MPTHGHPGCLIIAACGLNLVTDPPNAEPSPFYMPALIECRVCHSKFAKAIVAAALEIEAENRVRQAL